MWPALRISNALHYKLVGNMAMYTPIHKGKQFGYYDVDGAEL